MIKIFISLLFVLFYSSASVATESSNESSVNKPTFDCDEARSKAEKIICSSSDLSKLDQELATLYKQAKVIYSDNKDFKTEHNIEWKRRETECLDEDCITKWYENRKSQLNNWIEKSNLNISNNAKGISVVNGKDNNKSRINYSTYSNSSIIYVDPEKLSDFIAYIALIIFFLIVIGYIYKNSSSYKYGSNDNKKIVITKNYKGNQSESIRKFRDDAIEMARHGYFPTSQTWIQGNWGCSAFLIALILCFADSTPKCNSSNHAASRNLSLKNTS